MIKLSQKELVYNELFNKILSGSYNTKTRLTEEQIADEFGISRGPVREALRELAQDGLVDIIAHKGAFVFPFTADDVEDIFEFRKALEVLALGYAISNISLHRLTKIRSGISNAEDSNATTEDLVELDEELHRCITEASGKRRIIKQLEQMNRLLRPFRLLTLADREIAMHQREDHLKLIDTLMVRNKSEAKEVLANHIAYGKITVLTTIVKNHAL